MSEEAMKTVEILRLRDDAPVQFAATELARYLERMDEGIQAEVRRALRYAPEKPGIFLGLYEDFGLGVARHHLSGVRRPAAYCRRGAEWRDRRGEPAQRVAGRVSPVA